MKKKSDQDGFRVSKNSQKKIKEEEKSDFEPHLSDSQQEKEKDQCSWGKVRVARNAEKKRKTL